jgi:hypothetical protein
VIYLFPTRNYSVTLDIDKDTVQPVITAVVSDSKATVLSITFTDEFEPVNLEGITVKVFVIKPDGTNYRQVAEVVDTESGKARVVLDITCIDVVGQALAVISLNGANGEKLTFNTIPIEIVDNIN